MLHRNPTAHAWSRHGKASSHQGWGIFDRRFSTLTEGQDNQKQSHTCWRNSLQLHEVWRLQGAAEGLAWAASTLRQHSRRHFPEQYPYTLISRAQGELSAAPRAETMAEVMACDVQDPVTMNDDGTWARFSWETCFENPSHPAENLVQNPRAALNLCTVFACMLKS